MVVATLATAWAIGETGLNSHGLATVATLGLNVGTALDAEPLEPRTSTTPPSRGIGPEVIVPGPGDRCEGPPEGLPGFFRATSDGTATSGIAGPAHRTRDPGSFMMNHEILERHESEESCDEGISKHRAPCQCGHLGSELFSLLPFRVFRGE